MLTEEYRYKILKMVQAKPDISQRELAKVLGISLGKTNFCLRALVQIGLLEVSSFRNDQNKLAYMYVLTPKGIDQKATVARNFLTLKLKEYEQLRKVIEDLRKEIKTDG